MSMQHIDPYLSARAGDPFETVEERDVDLLLLEEWRCSPAFRDGVHAVLGLESELNVRGAFHSLWTPRNGTHRQSDCEVVYERPGAAPLVLLLENKIDATFQPEQIEGYGDRKRELEVAGYEALTVLMAPQEYLTRNTRDAQRFDRQLSYEAMLPLIERPAGHPERAKHRGAMLRRAIAKVPPRPSDDEVALVDAMVRECIEHDFPWLRLANESTSGDNPWLKVSLGHRKRPYVRIKWKRDGQQLLVLEDKPRSPSRRAAVEHAVGQGGISAPVTVEDVGLTELGVQTPIAFVRTADRAALAVDIAQAMKTASEMIGWYDAHFPNGLP